MTTDNKTLADVQPGGRVRLGDQAERARFEEWYVQNAFEYVANPIGSRDCALQWKAWQAGRAPMLESMWVEIRREGDRTFPRVMERSQAEAFLRTCNVGPVPTIQPLYAALSAQPSPGGQGDSVTDEMVDAACRAYYDTAEDTVAVDHTCMEAALKAALAARQPVGDCWSGWATQYPGAMPKLYGAREIAELNHHPEEGQRLIFLTEQPAQAVDLAENMLSVLIEEGVLARNGRVFQKLRALIDSMAVGK